MANETRRARIQGIGDDNARIIFDDGVIWADADGSEYSFTIAEALRRVEKQDWSVPAKGKEKK